MINNLATCPEHPDHYLREEYGSEVWSTLFCSKCPRHYPRCKSMHYMDYCSLIEGHPGPMHVFAGFNGGSHYYWEEKIPLIRKKET
jgi:hypothetical protein